MASPRISERRSKRIRSCAQLGTTRNPIATLLPPPGGSSGRHWNSGRPQSYGRAVFLASSGRSCAARIYFCRAGLGCVRLLVRAMSQVAQSAGGSKTNACWIRPEAHIWNTPKRFRINGLFPVEVRNGVEDSNFRGCRSSQTSISYLKRIAVSVGA